MQFTAADIAAFFDGMGEPVTLQHRATRLQITAIYNQVYEPGSPLDGMAAQERYSITAALADVAGVTAGWTATARGITRPVLSVAPDGSGFAEIHLGDPQ